MTPPESTRSAPTRDDLAARDIADPLAPLRDEFLLPEGVLYFDGNSLGPLPRAVPGRLQSVEAQWRDDLVGSWNRHDWIGLPRRVGTRIAPLVGADADEVVVCDSVSVNLFKLMAAALEIQAARDPERSEIVVQAEHFPTDVYVAEGLVGLLGERASLRRVATADLLGDPATAIGPRTAVVSLGHVDFRDGRLLPMEILTAAIHRAGALALWDLSHSAGALPVALNACGVDLAVGCGYKYLNGGPGAPSFLFVARALHDQARTPLAGWLGHAAPFDFAPRYEPAEGVARFVCGTPPILSMQSLDAALDLWDRLADLELSLGDVRAKSLAMGDAFLDLALSLLAELGVEVASPRDGTERGSQVCLRHTEAYRVMQALIERGVVGDFRAPDVLRFGICPLFLRHVDVWDAVETLREVLATGSFRDPRFGRRGVVT